MKCYPFYNCEGGVQTLSQSEVSIAGSWPIWEQHWNEARCWWGGLTHCPHSTNLYQQQRCTGMETSYYPSPHILVPGSKHPMQCKVKIYCFMLLRVYKNYPWLLFSPKIPRNSMLCVWELHISIAVHRSHNLHSDNVPRWYQVICNGIYTDWLTDTRVIDELGSLSSFLLATVRPLIGWHQFVRLLSGIMHDCQH